MPEPTITIRELVEEIDRQWQKGLSGDDAMRFLLPVVQTLLAQVAAAAARDEPVAAEVVTPGTEQTPYYPGEEVWTRSSALKARQWFVDQSGGFVEAPDA